jgi:hypothetical protein
MTTPRPTKKQLDALAVRLGLLPPDEWEARVKADVPRRERMVRTCGRDLGNRQANTRGTGKTTRMILESVWYAMQDRAVGIRSPLGLHHAALFSREASIYYNSIRPPNGAGSISASEGENVSFAVLLSDHAPFDQEPPRSTWSGLVTTEAAANMLCVSKHTLAAWRKQKRGPAFVRLGEGQKARIGYDVDILQQWANSHTENANLDPKT